ncbi:hypothetical protein HD806DRAFT_260537 [Xylariaceae sp. AK1471]|nr:hypothetical protein HD806DRAFT_260537 [Xylariaceae sp. AK1471]
MISVKQISMLVAGFGALAVPTYADGTIFQYCVDVNFGNCHNICGVAGQCIPVPAGLSSARGATGYNCYIFSDNTFCNGVPGGPVADDDRHYNLSNFGRDDTTMSIQCQLA